jgi:hypothetical protein
MIFLKLMSKENAKVLTPKIVLGVLLIVVLMLSMTVSVFGWHQTDEFNYWQNWGWLPWDWDKVSQTSEFYCANQYHGAKAVIVNSNNVRIEASKNANAKQWAKANTGMHKAKQWNSYYSHSGY